MGQLLAHAANWRLNCAPEQLQPFSSSAKLVQCGGNSGFVALTNQSQSSRNLQISGATGIQDINNVCEAISNVAATVEQILVPFVRAVGIAFMAIHSWEGFRRLVQVGKRHP